MQIAFVFARDFDHEASIAANAPAARPEHGGYIMARGPKQAAPHQGCVE
jgi:hypothetical protein